MKIKRIELFLPIFFCFHAGLVASAQNMYPSLSPLVYYNVDTAAITIVEDTTPKTTYPKDELERFFDKREEPDSVALTTPYDDVLCTKVGVVHLPLMEVADIELQRILSEIIDKTLKEDYSQSPYKLISRGVFFHICFYRDWRNKDRSVVMAINVLSNYYLGSSYEMIRKNHSDTNAFCCYYKGILGIITITDYTVSELIKSFFSMAGQNVTLHLYKKQRMILLFHSDKSNADVHSNAYGLYRRYLLRKKRLNFFNSKTIFTFKRID